MQRGQPLNPISEIPLAHDIVPPVDGLGFVPGELHGHGAGNARPFEVPDSGATQIMEQQARNPPTVSLLEE